MSYPPLKLKSKLDFVQRLTSKKQPFAKAKKLVNAANNEKDLFWKDHKTMSKPEEDKFVRYAIPGSPLCVISKQINNWLKSWDNLLPCHIYGGRMNKSAAQAAGSLLVDQGKNRFLLKTDLRRFFEQVDRGRIFSFLKNRCDCSMDASNYVADLCVVPEGPKNVPSDTETLARGFSPSTRLATWCNIEFFHKLKSMVISHFKGSKGYPQIVVYVDDILISVSNIHLKEVEELKEKIFALTERFDLEINKNKTKIFSPKEEHEVLGILMNKRSLSVPLRLRQKLSQLKRQRRRTNNINEKNKLKNQIYGLYQNQNQLKIVNQSLKENRNSTDSI